MIRLGHEIIGNNETGYQFVPFFPGILRRLKPVEQLLAWLPLGRQWVFWGKKTSAGSDLSIFPKRFGALLRSRV
jgi:hypothetical protein